MGIETDSGFLGFLGFFLLLLIWIALFLSWSISIWDIFRRHDLSGGARAGWFILVIFIPIVGTVIYLVAKPKPAPPEVTPLAEGASIDPADLVEKLAKLKEAGHLSEEEFEAQKKRLLG